MLFDELTAAGLQPAPWAAPAMDDLQHHDGEQDGGQDEERVEARSPATACRLRAGLAVGEKQQQIP